MQKELFSMSEMQMVSASWHNRSGTWAQLLLHSPRVFTGTKLLPKEQQPPGWPPWCVSLQSEHVLLIIWPIFSRVSKQHRFFWGFCLFVLILNIDLLQENLRSLQENDCICCCHYNILQLSAFIGATFALQFAAGGDTFPSFLSTCIFLYFLPYFSDRTDKMHILYFHITKLYLPWQKQMQLLDCKIKNYRSNVSFSFPSYLTSTQPTLHAFFAISVMS